MAQYKTVAGPVGLTISQNDSYAEAVKQYAYIINREAVGGWKLDCIQEIPVTKNNGCLAGLSGNAATTIKFNMLVFVKEDDISNSPATYVEPKRTTPPVVAAAPVATKGDPNKSDAPISAEIKDGEKVCPKCGTAQKIDRRVCWSCGQHFDN